MFLQPQTSLLPSIVERLHLSISEAGSNRGTWLWEASRSFVSAPPRRGAGWRRCLCTLLRFPAVSACRCVNGPANGRMALGGGCGLRFVVYLRRIRNNAGFKKKLKLSWPPARGLNCFINTLASFIRIYVIRITVQWLKAMPSLIYMMLF